MQPAGQLRVKGESGRPAAPLALHARIRWKAAGPGGRPPVEFLLLFPLLLAGLLLAAVFAFLFPLLGFVLMLPFRILGWVISLVLIHMVNRQSFHWSMELHPPWGLLGLLAAALLVLATLTALASGRRALGVDVVRAVREDW